VPKHNGASQKPPASSRKFCGCDGSWLMFGPEDHGRFVCWGTGIASDGQPPIYLSYLHHRLYIGWQATNQSSDHVFDGAIGLGGEAPGPITTTSRQRLHSTISIFSIHYCKTASRLHPSASATHRCFDSHPKCGQCLDLDHQFRQFYLLLICCSKSFKFRRFDIVILSY